MLINYPGQLSLSNWISSQANTDAWMYAKGIKPPNYPVPAIRVYVEIKPTYIMVWPDSEEWPYYPAAEYNASTF